MNEDALLESAREAVAEAFRLATEGPRRVPHPNALHEDGYLLPTAIRSKISEASEALQKIARHRHDIQEW